MRVVEKRFLRGPNIYRMAPCFVSLLDLEGHRPVELEDLMGGAALLRTLMPAAWAPVVVDAAVVARLLTRSISRLNLLAALTQLVGGLCSLASCSPLYSDYTGLSSAR